MDLRFSANIVQLPNLQLSCKLSRAFNALTRAVAGTAMACLLGAVFSVGLAAGQTSDDESRPTVTITGPTDVQTGAFTVTITFSETVTGFEQGDVTVGNGTVIAFAGEGASNSVTIKPTATGTVTVDVLANVAQDENGTAIFQPGIRWRLTRILRP